MLRKHAIDLVKELKPIISLLELNGLTSLENIIDYPEFKHAALISIKNNYIKWVAEFDKLDIEAKSIEHRYLSNLIRGTLGYDYRFERKAGTQLGLLVLEKRACGNCYKFKIYPF